jgi:hypothetical protein
VRSTCSSFGAQGKGKTTALWGSDFLGTHPLAHYFRPLVFLTAMPSARSKALAPRMLEAIFPSLERISDATDLGVAVSVLRVSAIGEIMNDCLNPDVKASGLGLRLRGSAFISPGSRR